VRALILPPPKLRLADTLLRLFAGLLIWSGVGIGVFVVLMAIKMLIERRF